MTHTIPTSSEIELPPFRPIERTKPSGLTWASPDFDPEYIRDFQSRGDVWEDASG